MKSIILLATGQSRDSQSPAKHTKFSINRYKLWNSKPHWETTLLSFIMPSLSHLENKFAILATLMSSTLLPGPTLNHMTDRSENFKLNTCMTPDFCYKWIHQLEFNQIHQQIWSRTIGTSTSSTSTSRASTSSTSTISWRHIVIMIMMMSAKRYKHSLLYHALNWLNSTIWKRWIQWHML